jgi:hypothetical protein
MSHRATIAFVILAACGGSQSMINTPLNWKPSDDPSDFHTVSAEIKNSWGMTGATISGPDNLPKIMAAFTGQKVQVMPFVDNRQVKDSIGANKENSTPRPVTTPDDVARFVSMHAEDVLRAAQIAVVPGGASRILSGELVQFFVTEDNRYNATVTLNLTLTDSAGKVLWQGPAVGQQNKFGHSFDASNYNEALSDAVVRALHTLLINDQFLAAVHG